MLQKLADHIASANAMAAAAEERAKQTSNALDRTEHLEMAKAWRHVAKSFEFVMTLEKFVLDAHKTGKPVRLDQLPKQSSE
jgi:hypothetical protein